MNIITQISGNYLRVDRSVEEIVVSNNRSQKTFFVYNFEGVHYRIFESKKDAFKCADGNTSIKPLQEFKDESALDSFLESLDIFKE